MSRARPIKDEQGKILSYPDGREVWLDCKLDGQPATEAQLELLATYATDCDLDDLLDEALTQGEAVKRLHEAFGRNPIPPLILEKRQQWREQRQVQPQCRVCAKQGDSTKHHFVNKWILRELNYYASKWADTRRNTIPVCIGCHRQLHARDDSDKSIVDYLTNEEKRFAHDAIKALLHEHPAIFELQVLGDEGVYEARLMQDWCGKRFLVTEQVPEPVAVAA